MRQAVSALDNAALTQLLRCIAGSIPQHNDVEYSSVVFVSNICLLWVLDNILYFPLLEWHILYLFLYGNGAISICVTVGMTIYIRMDHIDNICSYGPY
jgi:hypothetical protein